MRVKKTPLAFLLSYFRYFCRIVDDNSWECLLCRTLFGGCKDHKYLDQPYKCLFKNTVSLSQVVRSHTDSALVRTSAECRLA